MIRMKSVAVALGVSLSLPGISQVECRFESDRLFPADGQPADLFGFSLDADGDTVVVGTPGAAAVGPSDGVGYVLVRTPVGWEEQDKLVVADTAQFIEVGRTATVSGDYAAVGTIFSSGTGAAYVFERSGSEWSQSAKLTPSGAGASFFASSLSMSRDTLLVGAQREEVDGATAAGATYVFVRTGTEWTEQARLVASDGAAEDQFGALVRIEGDLALVGAPRAGIQGVRTGAAYVFTRRGTIWAETAKLVGDGPVDDRFGAAGDVGDDRIAVSAKDGGSGAVYVFERSGSNWNLDAKLSAQSTLGEQTDFGLDVVMDGDRVCGAAYDVGLGAVYVFDKLGPSWVETVKCVPSHGDMLSPWTVALTDEHILFGDYEDSSSLGSVYAFPRESGAGTYCTAKLNSCGTLPHMLATGFPSVVSPHPFVLSVLNAKANKGGLLLYGNSGKAALPFEGGLLCVAPPLSRSIALVDSAGTGANCDGILTIDMQAFACGDLGGNPAPFLKTVGTTINTQFWGRDTLANGSLLSDAYEYGICP